MKGFGLAALLVGAVLAIIAGGVVAQEGYQVARNGYDLSWWTADGGGYTYSAGGNYSLGGTIGQPDAGLLTGTGYTLAGGFWSGAGQPYRVYLPLVMRNLASDRPHTTADQIQASPDLTFTVLLPIVVRNYTPPPPQADLYIEVLQYETTDEYLQITNRGNAPQDMTGWRIHSVVGDQWYNFPAAYTLAAGASVRVHSGPDAFDNPPTDLLWGLAHVWLNEGDKAILYDDSNTAIDSFCYLDGCP